MATNRTSVARRSTKYLSSQFKGRVGIGRIGRRLDRGEPFWDYEGIGEVAMKITRVSNRVHVAEERREYAAFAVDVSPKRKAQTTCEFSDH